MVQKEKLITPPFSAGMFVWGFGALFYLMGFFHRVSPAVITDELMREFQIGAAALGNLSALYFYSYVAMQIPTGILADRLGPRRLLTLGSMVAALGTVLFGLSSTFFWAGLGRFLIGGSVAVAFVGLLKVASSWFAPQRFALVSGMALFSGVVGAVFAGTPMRLFVDSFGWRAVVLIAAGFTVIIGIGTWFFVRDTPHEKGYRNFSKAPVEIAKPKAGSFIVDLVQVFHFRNTPLLLLIPGAIVGAILTFSGLWGVPYLTTLYNQTPADAASLTSLLLIAWAIGGVFFGWISDRLKNRKGVYIIGCAIVIVGWLMIILIQDLTLLILTIIMVITGFSSGCMIISFAFVKESVPIRLAGTVSGVINMGVMAGPMILQPAVGMILDRNWSGDLVDGARVYSPEAYLNGFMLMLVWLVVAFILLLFTKETHCDQMP